IIPSGNPKGNITHPPRGRAVVHNLSRLLTVAVLTLRVAFIISGRAAWLAVHQICREYFRCFLSIIHWKENDRRGHGCDLDSFRRRTFAREFADFSGPGLD